MRKLLEWIDATGAVTPLPHTPTPGGGLIYQTQSGFGMPEIEHVRGKFPGQRGEFLRGLNMNSRSVSLKVHMKGVGFAGTERLRERVLTVFNPYLGKGTLRQTLYDDSGAVTSVRELREVVYESGLEFDTDQRIGSSLPAVIRLRAYDPYWYDPAQVTSTFALDQPGGITVPMLFPLNIAPEGIYSTQSIENTGQVETPVRIEITGPGTDPVIENMTTGKRIALTVTLTEGDLVVIETHERRPSIALSSGGTTRSLLGARSIDTRFWGLVSGPNQIRVRLTNASGGSVNLSRNHRFIGV